MTDPTDYPPIDFSGAPSANGLSRRALGGMALALAGLAALPGRVMAQGPGNLGPARSFSWDSLVARAQGSARRAFVPRTVSRHAAPTFDDAARLTYGDAQSLPGHVRLFPTRLETAPFAVAVNVVAGGQARAVVNTQGLFGAAQNVDPAGFRVMYADGHADWLAFLGASYFRAAGEKDQFGLSARGIAVDTGTMPGAEEFPEFTEFWIEDLGSEQGTQHMVIHALLEGPSLTGAYAFDTRQTQTGVVQDVKVALFLRKDVARLGIAPMTSMFCFDEATTMDRRDWRPEVHDSDGLAIWMANGERIWRPLENPPEPRTNTFRADSVKAFALVQRDQVFDHYQDDLNFYDRRPSLWVEPQGDWGAGAVVLYAFPTISETVDNVAAFWLSDRPAKAGQRQDFAYRLTWTSRDLAANANARCIKVFVGPGGVPGGDPIPGATRYVLDFEGEALAGLNRGSGVSVEVDLPAAAVLHRAVGPIAGRDKQWRVTLDIKTQGLAQREFRLFLKRGSGALSETVIKAVQP
ncbi:MULTISPECIES: glucan biosynthesis protein [unclassified Novosphingobium]|uniref:glucan biosynthesis protein n=1 Tax=unclassified Novosphingobium TaxID=2644732 RepID=UPI0018258BB4|nr:MULTISPECIES: glucan biosynthesis protein [unclassified Novosphingobium]NKJ43912.1 glucans biosynthesis protein [Novosphingobium sp. SG720]NMN06375.1 glucans biosynthesis protein [Novosphingobium sp. SG919]NMN88673.1 glucans biosynthesis protein [Novosphingobium sp. SG916]